MANRDNPHGLAPLMRNLSGGCPSVNQYSKDASESAVIYINDAVDLEDDGYIGVGGTPGTVYYQGVSLNHGATSTLTTHVVVDDPTALFEAQDDADTDGFAQADMGLGCNIVKGTGSSTTLISGHELDEGTASASNVLDVKLLRLLDTPGNAFGAHNRIEVIFNRHFLQTGLAGI